MPKLPGQVRWAASRTIEDVRDEQADRELDGGFDTSRSNQCTVCWQQKSAAGKCDCDD